MLTFVLERLSRSAGWVAGWLAGVEKLGIRLNSASWGWALAELGKIILFRMADGGRMAYSDNNATQPSLAGVGAGAESGD